jgi:TonB family protein
MSLPLAVVFASLLAQAAPAPVDTGQCLHEATVVNEPAAVYPASFPKDAWMFAIVTVTVGPDGTVQSAVMFKSTGTRDGDAEALRVARATTYSPKIVDCKAATGKYLLRVDFTPPGT